MRNFSEQLWGVRTSVVNITDSRISTLRSEGTTAPDAFTPESERVVAVEHETDQHIQSCLDDIEPSHTRKEPVGQNTSIQERGLTRSHLPTRSNVLGRTGSSLTATAARDPVQLVPHDTDMPGVLLGDALECLIRADRVRVGHVDHHTWILVTPEGRDRFPEKDVVRRGVPNEPLIPERLACVGSEGVEGQRMDT